MSILNDLTGKAANIVGGASEVAYGGGTIDTMKATIGKHGGAAKNNRFSVVMTPPTTSVFNLNAGDILDSVLTGGFDLKQLVNDPRDIAILCQRAALPSWNISTFEYQTDKQVNKFPYTYIHEDLTLSFLCTNDYYIKKMFDTWMGNIMTIDSHIANYKSAYTTDIVVNQLNEQNIPVYGYTFEKAYPVIVTAIEFEQGGQDLVKFDVTFAYDKFKPTGFTSAAIDAISNGFGKLQLPGGDALAQKVGDLSKRIGSIGDIF